MPCKLARCSAEIAPIDADLRVIIEAWPTLAEATKAAIVGMVRGK